MDSDVARRVRALLGSSPGSITSNSSNPSGAAFFADTTSGQPGEQEPPENVSITGSKGRTAGETKSDLFSCRICRDAAYETAERLRRHARESRRHRLNARVRARTLGKGDVSTTSALEVPFLTRAEFQSFMATEEEGRAKGSSSDAEGSSSSSDGMGGTTRRRGHAHESASSDSSSEGEGSGVRVVEAWRLNSGDAADRFLESHAETLLVPGESAVDNAQAVEWAREEAELSRRRQARITLPVKAPSAGAEVTTVSAWRLLLEAGLNPSGSVALQDMESLPVDEYNRVMLLSLDALAEESLQAAEFAERLRSAQKQAARSQKKKKQQPDSAVSEPSILSPLPAESELPFLWAFVLVGGGHFAGGVFCGRQLLRHRVVHRYTVRKKQGGSQTSKDQGKKIKSAGSHIRRTMTLKLGTDVLNILHNWSDVLVRCKRVFFAAPGEHYRQMLFATRGSGSVSARDLGYDSPLVEPESVSLSKPRPLATVCSIPFTTYRPSLAELTRCMQELASVTVGTVSNTSDEVEITARAGVASRGKAIPLVKDGPPKKGTDHLKAKGGGAAVASPAANNPKHHEPASGEVKSVSARDALSAAIDALSRSSPTPAPLAPELIDAYAGELASSLSSDLFSPSPLHTAARGGHVEAIALLLGDDRLRQAEVVNESVGQSGETPLHAAAAAGHHAIVTDLLAAGADPTLKTIGNPPCTAYDLASGQGGAGVRLSIRKFAGANPEQWNWKAAAMAGVVPLSEDSAASKAQARAEKRRRQKAAQKAKKQEQKRSERFEDECKRIVNDRAERDRIMPERERRALAAERRQIKMTPPDFGAASLTCRAPRGAAGHCEEEIMLVPFDVRGQRVCSAACVRAVLLANGPV